MNKVTKRKIKLHDMMELHFGEPSNAKSHSWLRSITGCCHVSKCTYDQLKVAIDTLQVIMDKKVGVRESTWDLLAKEEKKVIPAPIFTPVRGVMYEPCTFCPSAMETTDPEAEQVLTYPREKQLECAFQCAWFPGKLCRGFLNKIEATPAEIQQILGKA